MTKMSRISSWDQLEGEKVPPETQRNRDNEAARIIRGEFDAEKDPSVKEALGRELARMGQSTSAPSKTRVKTWEELDTPDAPDTPGAPKPVKAWEDINKDTPEDHTPVESKPTGELGRAVKGAQAFATGAVKSASLGLSKYPTAVMVKVLDQFMGDGKMTYKEALEATKMKLDEMEKENPKAMMAGNLVGGTAAAIGTGGGGLALQVGKTALAGGVSGFTENESLKDAAVGVGTGAAFGAAGAVAQKGMQHLVTKDARVALAKQAAKNATKLEENTAVLTEWMKKNGSKKSLVSEAYSIAGKAEVAKSVASAPRTVSARRGGLKTTRTGVPASQALNKVPEEVVEAAKNVKSAWGNQGQTRRVNAQLDSGDYSQVMSAGRSRLARDAIRDTREELPKAWDTLKNTAGGAVVGYGTGLLVGAENPEHWAGGGALLGGKAQLMGTAGGLARRLGTAAIPRIPQGTFETAARATTIGLTSPEAIARVDRLMAPTTMHEASSYLSSIFNEE